MEAFLFVVVLAAAICALRAVYDDPVGCAVTMVRAAIILTACGFVLAVIVGLLSASP